MFAPFALIAAALFTGAAAYITFVEHPARMTLDDRAVLTEWKPSYARGFAMQATLAVVGFLLGVAAWYATGNGLWLVGALVLVANWPYTLLVMMPTNKALGAIPNAQAGPASRAMLEKWGNMHAVRTSLGAVSTALFLWASVRCKN